MKIRICHEELYRLINTSQIKEAKTYFLGMSAHDKKDFFNYTGSHTVLAEAAKEYYRLLAFYWAAEASSL